ncbi:MAG: hypothetical protein JJW01_03565 [Alphaproteobacteria bacterium]|nr:hypothetical protein [Rickettsiales bacterium]
MAQKIKTIIKSNKKIENVVVNLLSKIVIPLILMFGFYIQFHGEVSPGGGFQSGIIFAVAFMMRDMLMSVQNSEDATAALNRLIPNWLALQFAAGGALIYGTTGVLCILLGYSLFDYEAFASTILLGGQIGLTAIEIGVCCTVFGAMMLIYNSFINEMLKRFYKHQ